MSSKINLCQVLTDHLRTLRNEKEKRISYLDLMVFFGIPLIIAAVCKWKGYAFSGDAIAAILTAMSVFSALLINVLVLIYGLVRFWT